jgi:hypothetical protein
MGEFHDECIMAKFNLLTLKDHRCLQFWYEIMHAAGPELPTASAVPILPKVSPYLR